MNIKTAIFQQLNSIPELTGKVDYNVAKELQITPRVVYKRTNDPTIKTLDGPIEDRNPIFDIDLYCKERDDLFDIEEKIREKLLSLEHTTVGGFFIKNVELDSRDLHENTVGLHRIVFEFEIYY